MDSYNTARLCDFQICRKHGRVIDKIERFYTINNDPKGKKERITLSDVLARIATAWDIQSDNYDNIRKQYIKRRFDNHPRKIQWNILFRCIWSCGLLGFVMITFMKFVFFRLYPATDIIEGISNLIAFWVVAMLAFRWKFYLYFRSIKVGKKAWIHVVEFYDSPKRYFRNIGSDRANRTNNFENDDMYLHALLDGKKIHLPVEYGLYKNICDLKEIPVFVHRDKIFIDEYSVNVERLRWR